MPVAVSFWISITALIACFVSAARCSADRFRIDGAPIGRRHAPRLPARSARAVFAQRSAKKPVCGTSTLSPGEKRFAMLASQAPLPEAA